MNAGKIMEGVGFLLIVGSFGYGLYQNFFNDAPLNVSTESLPYILGMLIWALGYMMNPERQKKD